MFEEGKFEGKEGYASQNDGPARSGEARRGHTMRTSNNTQSIFKNGISTGIIFLKLESNQLMSLSVKQ